MWDGHLESRKNPDRLQRSIHVDRIGVHSTFVYIYAGLRTLITWANCLFPFNMSFLLRKVEDVTTISKSQSLTSVSIKDCTLRVPNETNTLFLLRVIIKAIFIQEKWDGDSRPGVARVNKVTPVSLGLSLSVFNKNSSLTQTPLNAGR